MSHSMDDSKLKVVGPWPEPPVPEFDDESLMVPPWIKFPNLPRGSIGWRMGIGEDYRNRFDSWVISQPRKVEIRVREKYPEPTEWEGYYRGLKKV